MIFARSISEKLKKALLSAEKPVIILYGPRQAGKTTLVQKIIAEIGEKHVYFSGDDLYAQELLCRHELAPLQRIFDPKVLAVVDEAQKIDNIGQTLKLMHDNIGVRIIASGSASFDLANKVNEPLTGRTKTFWLYPLSYEELFDKYRTVSPSTALEDFLLYGAYPRVHNYETSEEKQDYLYEYTNKYLYQDILSFSGTRKPKSVVDLLVLLAHQIGSEVSVSELAKNLSLSQTAVARYLDILEKMFVIVSLRGFSRNLRKEVAKSSKYYFLDLGVRNALIRNFNPVKMRDDGGAMFENYFIIEKIKLNEKTRARANFYFWRTYDQQEIDLIEERAGKLFAYECKLSPKKAKKAPSAWSESYPDTSYKVVTSENYSDLLC